MHASGERLGFIALLSLIAGCQEIRATDGSVFPSGSFDSVVQASAARDIPCAMGGVAISGHGEGEFNLSSADGCGQRVTYMLSCESGAGCRAVLVARLALTRQANVVAAPETR